MRLLPLDWLGLTVAAVVLIALLVSIFTPGGHLRDTAGVRTTTGLLSGFMSVTAGVGGPALAVYARGIDWRHRSFAATAQLQFLVTASASLLVKFHVPDFSALGWVMLAGGMLLGLLIGERVAGRLSGRTAMRLVMVLAMAGTLVALGRAIWNLWGPDPGRGLLSRQNLGSAHLITLESAPTDRPETWSNREQSRHHPRPVRPRARHGAAPRTGQPACGPRGDAGR